MTFGRATRIKRIVSDLAEALGLAERWQVEVAAMLSQLGYMILPAETLEKVYYGLPLSEPEEESDEEPVIVVSDRGRVIRVPLSDVLYLKAELKYVTLRTAQHRHPLASTIV